MTRDFIFDANGAVIGYRCRVEVLWAARLSHQNVDKCNRLFATVRGLRQHQRKEHGLFMQLSFKEVEALEKNGDL